MNSETLVTRIAFQVKVKENQFRSSLTPSIRNSKARGLLFYRLMEHAVECAPVPRPKIIGGEPQHMVVG
jgi:hypothetical protein